MKNWSRRNFIKAGATTLTIPFLESIPNVAMAASASGSLKRIMFFCLSNAWYEDIIFPKSKSYLTGAEGVRYIPLNSLSGDISQMFTAAKYGNLKSKMNLMRGFDLLSTPGGSGGHRLQYALGASDELGSSSVTNSSIDALISNSSQFYPTAPFKTFLNAFPVKDGRADKYNYSYQGGSSRSVLGGPTSIFTEFFSGSLPSTGGGGGTTTPTTPTDTNLSRRIALEGALSKISAIAKSTKLSTSDKAKLDAHGTLISKLLPSIAAPTGTGGGSVSVGGSCSKPSITSGINESVSSSSGNQARLRACMDQIYMAFNCQLTNMAVLHPYVAYDSGNWEMGDTGNDQYHQLAGHHYDPAQYLKLKGWLFDQLLYLINMMDSTKESNGLTMLDNSLIVVVSNDACSIHSTEDIPVITFGSLGGLLKTGNYINYQRTDSTSRTGELEISNAPNAAGEYYYRYNYNLGRPFGQFYTTLLNVLKIPHSGFGSYADSGGKYSQFTSAAGKQASLPIIT